MTKGLPIRIRRVSNDGFVVEVDTTGGHVGFAGASVLGEIAGSSVRNDRAVAGLPSTVLR